MPILVPTHPVPAARPRAPRRRQPEVHALLSGALAAFRAGRDAGAGAQAAAGERRPAPQPGPLPAADRAQIDRLAVPRERALALARGGKLPAAAAQMQGARLLLSLARLSPAGAAYARTMHEAAESYLSYQHGDHADAYARMTAALDATERLAAAWGECEFIACRRIDLAHNLMRVEVRRGAAREAMRRGAGLLERIAGGSRGEDGMDPGIAAALFDLVAATTAELLAPLAAEDARDLLAPLARLRAQGGGPSPRAREWLALRAAAAEDDPRPFLRAAPSFLRAGRGSAPALWYSVALELLHLQRTLDPHGGSAAVEEIAAELAAGPRAPACMRDPGAPRAAWRSAADADAAPAAVRG